MLPLPSAIDRNPAAKKKSATAKSWADCGLALAVFVKRPQADAQIGAVVTVFELDRTATKNPEPKGRGCQINLRPFSAIV
jgi:hypothetical protein